MNIYADEKFYKEAYLCGKTAVIISDYEYFFREASLLIDRHTFRNIDPENIPQAVKMCCCELAENLFSASKSQRENVGIQSESVGDWSRNYTSKSEFLLINADIILFEKNHTPHFITYVYFSDSRGQTVAKNGV